MEKSKAPPPPQDDKDPGVKIGPGTIEKILIIMSGVLLVILFITAFAALFPITFNGLIGRGG